MRSGGVQVVFSSWRKSPSGSSGRGFGVCILVLATAGSTLGATENAAAQTFWSYGNGAYRSGFSSTFGDGYIYNGQGSRRRPDPTIGRSPPRPRGARTSAREDAGPPRPAPKTTDVKLPKSDPGRPAVPLLVVVSLKNQRVNVYSRDGVVAESRVSTGQSGYRTPTGVFSILQRNRHHESNIYSGAPMPFMQRLTWSGIALHAGNVPNYPASHGCIRLPAEFASMMWGLTRLGTRVIVSPSEVTPIDISHPVLPAPKMTPVPVAWLTTRVQTAATITLASILDGDQRDIDPYHLALVRRARILADRAQAEQSVAPALELAQRTSAEAAGEAQTLREAEATLAAALSQRLRSAPGGGDSDLTLEAARAALVGARSREAQASDAAFAAATAARAAENESSRLVEAAKTISSSLEPVSIFVSRRERRVFVRQGFVVIHDEPVTIADPDLPLGTHVFTAMDAGAEGTSMRWLAVTMPDAVSLDTLDEGRVSKRDSRTSAHGIDAKQALDRLELPADTRKLVAERLWPGASLIVSDHGIGKETGKGTDFIVLTD